MLRQPLTEIVSHIAEIAAGSVYQEDRGRGRAAEFDDVKPTAIDVHKSAARQIGPIDHSCAGSRDNSERRQRSGDGARNHGGYT